MTRPLDVLRVLIGVILVVTALGYFMPFALGFVPQHEWSDPMALRVMTGFEKSGLLAVAKFIHLLGGLMLLTNRAAPFALAALMPVHLCGLYLSLFLEGDPLVALLAVLMVAGSALLMLAYLPYYAGVLGKDQLADGEGPEAGANYESIYVNPMSRTPASAYLAGGLTLLAAIATYIWIVPGLNGTTGLVTLAIPAVLLLVGMARALTKGPSPD